MSAKCGELENQVRQLTAQNTERLRRLQTGGMTNLLGAPLRADECCAGVRSCAAEFEAHEKKLKKQDGFLKRVVNPALAVLKQLGTGVTKISNTVRQHHARLVAVETQIELLAQLKTQKDEDADHRVVHAPSKPEAGGDWDLETEESFLIAKEFLTELNSGHKKSTSTRTEENLVLKNAFSFAKSDNARKTKTEASRALETLFLQLSIYAEKQQLTLDTIWNIADNVLLHSTFRDQCTDPDLTNTVSDTVTQNKETRLAQLQRRVARVVRTNSSMFARLPQAEKEQKLDELRESVRSILVRVLLCDVYRAAFAASSSNLSTAPGGDKMEVHHLVIKREDMDQETVDLDIRRWLRNAVVHIYRAMTPGERSSMMNAIYRSLAPYSNVNNALQAPFNALNGGHTETSVERVMAAAQAYIDHVEANVHRRNGGLQTTNFPESQVKAFVLKHGSSTFARGLKTLYPSIAEEIKAQKNKDDAANKNKKSKTAQPSGEAASRNETAKVYPVCTDWRTTADCSAADQCPNKADHKPNTKNVRTRVHNIINKMPEGKRPDYRAAIKCLIAGGDEAAVKKLPAASK